MLSVAQPAENQQFAQEFADYRKACRDKYLQQQAPAHEQEEKEEELSTAESVDEIVNSFQDMAVAPVESDATTTSTVPDLSSSLPATPLPSIENMKKSGALERRNSLSKVINAVSNVFAKKSSSPTISKKKLTKEEKEKKEQDWRMARLIAELEFSGKTDQEIQMHLFHIRDQSQFTRPRSNSVGDWFKCMHQAFKDEFSLRRDRQVVSVHVSTVNPFYAAPSANGNMDELGYTYEDLVALENVPRGVKCLDHLPVLTFEGQELPSAQTSCAVCMMEFEKTEELRALRCTHHFHRECIDKWLSVGSTCPVCKGEVESDA